MSNIEKYKPAVPKAVLYVIVMGLWASVGGMLLFLGFSWLLPIVNINRYIFAGCGLGLALLLCYFMFLRIVDKNIERIRSTDGKSCIFSFMPWKSYMIIPLMITMGVILRHSSVPKQYLAILYIGMGLALLLSSARYLRVLFKELKSRK